MDSEVQAPPMRYSEAAATCKKTAAPAINAPGALPAAHRFDSPCSAAVLQNGRVAPAVQGSAQHYGEGVRDGIEKDMIIALSTKRARF
eukprot:3901362-Pleurochrysis_carterae.AAC.4